MIRLIYSNTEGVMSPEYLAGFFDGEGCIDTQRLYVKTRKAQLYVRPRIRVSQTVAQRAVMDMIHRRFGGHMAYRKSNNSKRQDSVSLEFLSEHDMRRLLKILLPHLIVKRQQAKLVLWWLDNAKGLQRQLCPGIEQARAILVEELAAMKRDPQRLSGRAIQRIKLELMRKSELGGDVETRAETTLARAA